MKSSVRPLLCLPGETERELWKTGQGGAWEKTGGTASGAGCIFALEALASDSVPFWTVAPQDGKVDVAGVSSIKWESLGITEGGEGLSTMHWNVGQVENRVLVGSAGLAPDFPSEEWLKTMPQSFELSPRLYPIPDDEGAVWKELGRYVVAFNRGKRLLHFCVLSARELDASAAQEIGEIVLALETQGMMTKLAGMRMWTEVGTDFTNVLIGAVSAPVRPEPKPAPVLPEDACSIFPPVVERTRRSRAQARKRASLVFALAAAYIVFFAAWAGWLFWREQKLGAQLADMSRRHPALEEVSALQSRWKSLESATNVDGYPAEVFQRIVSLLPAEGIRLKEFNLDLNKLVVSGEASTVGHALKFKSDLTSNEGLRKYTWTFPQPNILEDNRANFRAEGTLNREGETNEIK
ncbi:MAG: hypothetical protein WCN98_13620 [Verrucomicrobiaceae bacterium]